MAVIPCYQGKGKKIKTNSSFTVDFKYFGIVIFVLQLQSLVVKREKF